FAGRITDRSLRMKEGKSGGDARQEHGRDGPMQPFSALEASKSVAPGSSPAPGVKPIFFVARRDGRPCAGPGWSPMTRTIDPVIQIAVAEILLGSVVIYIGGMVALMYPVLEAAGYLG